MLFNIGAGQQRLLIIRGINQPPSDFHRYKRLAADYFFFQSILLTLYQQLKNVSFFTPIQLIDLIGRLNQEFSEIGHFRLVLQIFLVPDPPVN